MSPRQVRLSRIVFLAAGFLVACATLPVEERVRRELDRGDAMRAEMRLKEAAAAYDKAYSLDPTHLAALRGLVETHQKLGRLSQLEQRFAQAIDRAPGDPYAQQALGLVYFSQGGSYGPKAFEYLQKAAELAPEVADFHYRLGVAYVENDRYRDAVDPLTRAVELDPKKARYRLPYAIALARTGERTKSVEQLEAVLQHGPTPEEVRLAARVAKVLLDPFRGFPPAAREQFEVGLSWLMSDAPQQAQMAFNELVEKYPDLAIVHAVGGLSAAQTGEAGRAIDAYRRAIELDPQLAEPRMYLGDLYLARGRPETALEHFETAVRLNPLSADARARLADVRNRMGDKAGAADAFGVYLLLQPEDFEAHLSWAGLLADQRKTEAGDAWDDLVRKFPRRVEGLVAHGRYWFQRAAETQVAGEREKAKDKSRRSLEKVLDIDKENTVAPAILQELRKL